MKHQLTTLFVALTLLLIVAPPVTAQEGIVVTSIANDGPGTLREALMRATPGTTIIFDPEVFPLDAPTTIYIEGEPLPPITAGNITIDGTQAGVILDGSRGNPEDPWFVGVYLRSDENIIKGMTIVNFPFAGIWIAGDRNLVGGRNATPGGDCTGDCNILSGNGWATFVGTDEIAGRQIETHSDEQVLRVGNTISGNYIGTDVTGTRPYGDSEASIMGIALFSAADTLVGGDTPAERNVIGGHVYGIFYDAEPNVIKGNYVGVGATGEPLPNETGMWVREARGGVIGPNNVIAYNTSMGLDIRNSRYEETGLTITQNEIYANGTQPVHNIWSAETEGTAERGISLFEEDGVLTGFTTPGATVEIYSGDDGGARHFEGIVAAGGSGMFTFEAPENGFAGPWVTALATSPEGTTRQFAAPIQPQPAPPPIAALSNIPRPKEVSLEPEDLGISLGLAIVAMLFFGFTSNVFNSLFEEHAADLQALLPSSVRKQLARWEQRRALHVPWQIALAWLGLLLLAAAIESFLEPGPVFGRERLGVFAGLLIAGLILGGVDLLLELGFRRRVLPKTGFEFEFAFFGLIVAIGAVVLSRAMHFQPGYVYGIVGILLLMPDIPDRHAGRYGLISIGVLLGLGLTAWLLTLAVPAGTALESILLTLFLVSVDATFFAMLPFLADKGRDIWQWQRRVWAALMAGVLFVFFHLLLQPGYEDVQLMQQNSLQTVLILMGIFGAATLGFWAFILLRERRGEARAALD